MRFIFIALSILFLASRGHAQKMFPAAAVPQAVEKIFIEIKDQHPYVATFEGLRSLEEARSQVQTKMESAIGGRDSITYVELVSLAAPMQEITYCGHLILRPYLDSTDKAIVNSNYFPISLTRVETGDYVLRKKLTTTIENLEVGTIVTKLNGRDVDEVLQQFVPFGGANDNGYDEATLFRAARNLSTPYQLFYGLQDRMELTAMDGAGQEISYTVIPEQRPWVDKKKVETPIAETLEFRMAEDSKTGILKIKKFSVYEFTDGNYYDFIDHVFDTLKATGTDRLIIDIRDNGGGSSSRISYLYKYLADRKFKFTDKAIFTGPARAEAGEPRRTTRRRAAGAATRRERKMQKGLGRRIRPKKDEDLFTGNVVVLINEGSFSASGIFARMVQGSGRGTLVGSVSGASASIMYGGRRDSDPLLIGPNEEFELLVNTIGLVPEFPIEGNITPDHLVRPSLAGIRAGRDEVLEKGLEVVR